MEAAFFDLDKTVIARASIMAFARDFRSAGMLPRRAVARGVCSQFLYVRFGASNEKLDRIRKSVLSVTRGWEQERVRSVVTEKLATRIDPITFLEARRLIEVHRRAGRLVYLVSAAPGEVVEPVAAHLGADGAIASRATVDEEGRYTGEVERYAYGRAKAELVQELADELGIDLSASFAYSDSATDVPMLEAVGHPAAVNPDRDLRRISAERGWEILHFADRMPEARPEVVVLEVEGRSWAHPARWAVPASIAATAAAAVGGATALAWRHHTQPT